MVLFNKCVVCKDIIDKKIVSLYHVSKWGRITSLVCKSCYNKTKDKWDENDWNLNEESNNAVD